MLPRRLYTSLGHYVEGRARVEGYVRQPKFWMLVGVLLVASLLRLWNLGNVGLRGDEAVYAGQAAILAGDEELKKYFIPASRGNSNFLLYQYVVAFAYLLFGVSDLLARVVSATCSILTILVTFEIGRTLYNTTVGLLAALLLALSSYAVSLGRLALLDSTMVFIFAVAVLCIAKWARSDDDRWLYAFGAGSALAVQAKITAVVVVGVFGLFLVIRAIKQGSWPRLRTLIISGVFFVVFLAPVVWQVTAGGSRFLDFLSQSSGRRSAVPWYYYLSLITGYEGWVTPLLWLTGLLILVWRRLIEDFLLIMWLGLVILFHQLYPLKAFNYLLPAMPVLSLLAAHAIQGLWSALRMGRLQAGLAIALVAMVSSFQLSAALQDSKHVGLREASYWLEANTAPEAGVMMLSQGSGQSIIPFYARRDAYPFGRFRLATVLPGPTVLEPRPTTKGTPRDWVALWPAQLIEAGTVSYLLFFTDAGDDPPEEPIAKTATQRKFRDLIETYDGRLVHTVYHNHEPRVWIYEVRKRSAKPSVDFAVEEGRLKVEGRGFHINSEVYVSYHNELQATVPTDGVGSFSVSLVLPSQIRPSYFLVAVDRAGNYASMSGRYNWGYVERDLDADPWMPHLVR